MKYRFFICDVFSSSRFGGNQLAVLPEAEGLSTVQMQQIAREFNYSESTFVTKTEDKNSRKVRIFTPSTEVPFAGHPNIGTAFALANDGEFGDIGDGITVHFEEQAGTVPVSIRRVKDDGIWCELLAPEQLSLGAIVARETIAKVLSLEVDDINVSNHAPQVASVGLPFLMVELTTIDALQRAKVDTQQLEALRDSGVVPDVHLYVQCNDDFDIRARMFAPFDGVPEDPATGSANCALVALLTHLGNGDEIEENFWRIAQGVEMGRPSVLEARTRRENGTITTWIGGNSIMVADGYIEV